MEERMNRLIQLFKEANERFLDKDKNLILTDVNGRRIECPSRIFERYEHWVH
jgi:hypothetical protein